MFQNYFIFIFKFYFGLSVSTYIDWVNWMNFVWFLLYILVQMHALIIDSVELIAVVSHSVSWLIEFALHACVIGCTCYLLCDIVVNSLNKLVPLLVSVECNKPLDSSNCNDHDGDIFCNACYRKKFGHQGYGSVLAGDGIRNSDTPRESVLSAAFNLIF